MEVEEFLEHYGVLGMHWGVRKDRPSGGTRIRTQRTFTGYYGSNNKNSLKGVGLNLMSYLGGFPLAAGATSVISPMSMVYHTSRREIKHQVKKINQKYTAPGHDIRTTKSLQKAYNRDVQEAIHTAINRHKSAFVRPLRAVANVRAGKHVNTEYDVDFYMTDSWNKAAFIVLTSPKGKTKDLRVGFAKHSDEEDDSVLHLEVLLPRNEDGLITDFIIPELEDEASHADAVDEFLSHYGILGMRWGVRKDPISASGERFGMGVTVRGLPELTKENIELSSQLSNAVHSLAYPDPSKSDRQNKKTQKRINSGLDEINKRWPVIDNDVMFQTYRMEVVDHFNKVLEKNVPKGYRGVVMKPPNHNDDLVVVVGNKAGLENEIARFKERGFTHSDSSSIVQLYTLKTTLDASRHIVGVEVIPENVEHSDGVNEFLAHYGILGMHWGVRRSRAQLSRAGTGPSGRPAWQSPPPARQPAPSPPASRSPKLGRLSREKTPPSQDALEIHALRQKVKKHGMSSLTNEDLQKIAKRAELQQKYNTAFPKPVSKKKILGQIAVEQMLTASGEAKITGYVGARNPDAAVAIARLLDSVRVARKVSEKSKSKKK